MAEDLTKDVDEDDFELDPEDFFKLTWLMIIRMGGIVVVDNEKFHKVVPENASIEPHYDEKTKSIAFVATPFPHRNKVLRPKRKRGIIIPGRN